MSIDLYQASLSTNAQTEYLLSVQSALKDAVRQTLSLTGSPSANKVYHRLLMSVNQAISHAHAEYILGRGPTSQAVFQTMRIMSPDMSSQEIVAQYITPKLPRYTNRGEPEDGADRSTNRHWATMARVGLGANEQNQWNHEVLDRWFEEGRIQHFSDYANDREAMNQSGAVILRLDLNNGEHAYCVRVVTSEYNRNTLVLHEGDNGIEAAVLVEIEGMWATHDDGGLIDDAEVEGYIQALLEQYGIAEEPLPIRPSAEPAPEEEVSAEEIAQMAADVEQDQASPEAADVYAELQERQEIAQAAGVDLSPAPETREEVAALQAAAAEQAQSQTGGD